MAEDTRNYIDQTQSLSMDYSGKELSPAEMATEFAKWGIDDRVKALQELRADDSDLTITEAAKRHRYESALRNTHDILRKAGR